MKRSKIRTVAGAALLLASALGGCSDPPPPGETRVSLLAVGDTGARPDDTRRHRLQLAVGSAMEAEDRERPVQGLVLLGDNFYDRGLRREELVSRVRANVVQPYCRFLALTGPRSAEVAGSCEASRARSGDVALLAVLGNHDRGSPESPALQRDELPRFVSNWQMPTGPTRVHELPGGLSLVLFDSAPAFEGGEVAPLVEALRSARGPWRVLVSHHPIAAVGRGDERLRYKRFRRRVLQALEASGAAVQLVLSGHEHNLQLLTMPAPAPALHVIAGGGSGSRKIRVENGRRLAGFERPGYARVDLIGTGPEERLVASLVALPRLPARLLWKRSLATRWSVNRAGRVAEE